MNFKAMNQFLSEENIKRHLEHLREYKLKLSILVKSIPELKGLSFAEILKSDIKREVKNEASELLWYIKSHECFFNSFSDIQPRSLQIEKSCGSTERFIYDLYTEAMAKEHGFLYVCMNGRGKPIFRFSDRFDGAFVKYHPSLAIDLYEHTYFLDYGFQKDRFLSSAVGRLDISKLS